MLDNIMQPLFTLTNYLLVWAVFIVLMLGCLRLLSWCWSLLFNAAFWCAVAVFGTVGARRERFPTRPR